jgi:hypothetical protein
LLTSFFLLPLPLPLLFLFNLLFFFFFSSSRCSLVLVLQAFFFTVTVCYYIGLVQQVIFEGVLEPGGGGHRHLLLQLEDFLSAHPTAAARASRLLAAAAEAAPPISGGQRLEAYSQSALCAFLLLVPWGVCTFVVSPVLVIAFFSLHALVEFQQEDAEHVLAVHEDSRDLALKLRAQLVHRVKLVLQGARTGRQSMDVTDGSGAVGSLEHSIRVIFDQIDKDKSGGVSPYEISRFIRKDMHYTMSREHER